MKHRLAPDFILEHLVADVNNGRFYGAAMFLDVSGFSTIMDTLMRHGQHGSEIMALLMRTLFEPLVASVYGHQGYIVGFAGDAFTAVFPTPHQNDSTSSLNALAAAWEIQTHLASNDEYHTEYGSFQIGAKVGLAFGEIEWGILQANNQQRATFYYKGEAIQSCSDAEHYANRKEILCDHLFLEQLTGQIEIDERDPYYLITAVNRPLPLQNESPSPDQAPELIGRFFPEQLVTQSISGEFRQIINLFINLKGSPPPDKLSNFMETVFALQDLYGGLLNRIDFGDKGCHLLFFWGAPTSYENDISRVLYFVQELQHQTDLTMRIGITYRIAHAGFIGSLLHEEYTCYGRGVNLAARFMTSAKWGEIWVDENIAERSGNLFSYKHLGQQAFKGFTEPQYVHQFLGRQQIAQTPFYQGNLIGRDHELAILDSFLAPIFNGRFAGTAIITGEAGIGKSRLIHDYFIQNQIFNKANVFLCQTDEIIRQSLNPFRYWLRDHFNQSSTQSETRNREQFDLKLNQIVEQMPTADAKNEIARTQSFLGAVLGLHWPESLYEQLEPQLRFENILNAIKTLIKTEASNQPIIIQLEDTQWIDEDSLKFLQRLTRNIEHFPIAIVLTTREPFLEEHLEKGTSVTHIQLGNLEKPSTNKLVIEKIGAEPNGRFLDWIMERTAGNPFFVEQMILYLKENEFGMDSEDQLAMLQAGSLLPTDVRSVLTARLDRLPSNVKEAIQNASVLGREFDKPVLKEMLSAHIPITQTLDQGTEESIWVLLTQIRYLFRHMLLRDAAYEMQVHSRLKMLHKKAAIAFESVYESDLAPHYSEIAHHYDRAAIKVKAIDYYERAADQARESYQNEEALDQYNRALSLTKTSDFERKYRLLSGKEAVLNWMGRREEQESVLSELTLLMENSTDLSKASQVSLLHAAYALVTNQYEQALSAAQRSAETAVSAQDKLAEARAYHRWGRAYWQQGKYQNALPYLETSLKLSRAMKSAIDEAQTLYDLSVVHFFDTKYDLALRFLELANTLYDSENEISGGIRCQLLKGIIFNNTRQFLLALENNEKVLSLSKEFGWRYAEARTLMASGNTLLEIGGYRQAKSYLQQAINLYIEIGDQAGLGSALDSLGFISCLLEEYVLAEKHFVESIDINRKIQQLDMLGYVLTHYGYCLNSLGKYQDAHKVLGEAVKIREQLESKTLKIDSLAAFSFTLLKLNQFDIAKQALNEIIVWLDEFGVDGIEFPHLVYLTAYEVSIGLGFEDEANWLLSSAYNSLIRRSKSITEPKTKEIYLSQIPHHKKIIAHWKQANELANQ
ncbi:MAG: tetratricopeptide repeat protein [Chloroflexota bacterium]